MPFEKLVIEYTPDNFAKQIYNNLPGNTPTEGSPHPQNAQTYEVFFEKSSHLYYFKDYFSEKGLNAKFILIEQNYVQRDWISDYTTFYASCFQPPARNTKRLHFFSSFVMGETKEAFCIRLKNAIFLTEEEQQLENKKFWEDEYLGSMVVKPLPINAIGLTTLKHYNYSRKREDKYNEDRIYWGVTKQDSNISSIFGRPIKLESLSFQSQDSNLAACASVAIATMLHVASKDKSVQYKTPGEVTKLAGAISKTGDRMIPNSGLYAVEMCQAINSCGLEPSIRVFGEYKHSDRNYTPNKNNHDTLYLKKIVNAYSTMSIPLILSIFVPYGDSYAGHAIAISGHRVCDSNKHNKWKAEGITKIFAMDDGFGSYVRMEFTSDSYQLTTPWGRKESFKDWESDKNCYLWDIIIPVFPKIRIHYDEIEGITENLNDYIEQSQILSKKDTFWDIQLHYGVEYKRRFLENYKERTEKEFDFFKARFIQESLPRYIWVVTCSLYEDDEPFEAISFLFDATGMTGSRLGLTIIFHDAKLEYFFRNHLKTLDENQVAPYVRFWKERAEKQDYYIAPLLTDEDF